MAKEIVIERLEGKGIKARVLDGGAQYSTYMRFASSAGYPDAAQGLHGINATVNAASLVGKTVDVLARGDHEYPGQGEVYVCQSAEGRRFLINRTGIELIEIPTLKTATFEELLDELMERIKGGEGEMPRTEPTRADIVAQAKADIEGLKYGTTNYYYYLERPRIMLGADFVVNAEKRTVVALLRGCASGKVYVKGIAKCDPSDCFNEHIGKAIALRRALGLDVPAEYLNAPQPTEVLVGDIIRAMHRPNGSFYVKTTSPLRIINSDLQNGIIKVINDSARY